MELGYNPEIILSGRRLNDSMGPYVAQESIKLMIRKGLKIHDSNTLVLGITFKEDCPDIRNSRAIDIIEELKSYSINVDVYDPWASKEEVKEEYGIDLLSNESEITKKYDALILAVSHKEFLQFDMDAHLNPGHVTFDVKSILAKGVADSRL
jgi:UDP-N-acetyl-D-galactosamine dehydrogenase